MPYVEYKKADENDYEELVDLIDLVFSRGFPHDFETLLPAQYKKHNFMTGNNYIVKESGKIVANVGAYPVDYYVCGDNIKISALTTVAVHPRYRSKGYMIKLMEMALQDMRKDSIDLSFLYGARQRYEYFGYTPCGVRYDYYCDKHNINHSFGKTTNNNISLKEPDGNDTDFYDSIFNIYHTGNAYIKRPRKSFPDIMNTWENKTLGVYKDGQFAGYISASKDRGSISEMKINDIDLIGDVLKVYLEKFERNDVSITAFPFETELNESLSRFTGSVSVHSDGNLYIINYLNILSSFIKLKCTYTKIPNGAITFSIRDIGNITISISNNHPSVMFTDEKPDAELSHLEAERLFFSPASAFSLGPVEGNILARCLFPIPLLIRRQDRS